MKKERCFIIKLGNGPRLKTTIYNYRIISNKKKEEKMREKNDNLVMKVFLGHRQDT